MRGFEKFPVGKRKAQTLNFDGQIEECFSLDESLSPAFCLKEQAAAENVSALFPSHFYGGYAFAEGKLYALTESGLLAARLRCGILRRGRSGSFRRRNVAFYRRRGRLDKAG